MIPAAPVDSGFRRNPRLSRSERRPAHATHINATPSTHNNPSFPILRILVQVADRRRW